METGVRLTAIPDRRVEKYGTSAREKVTGRARTWKLVASRLAGTRFDAARQPNGNRRFFLTTKNARQIERFFIAPTGIEPTLGGSGQSRPLPKSVILSGFFASRFPTDTVRSRLFPTALLENVRKIAPVARRTSGCCGGLSPSFGPPMLNAVRLRFPDLAGDPTHGDRRRDPRNRRSPERRWCNAPRTHEEGGTTFINVSICTRAKPSQKPVVVDL
jgi:hypothetical protein